MGEGCGDYEGEMEEGLSPCPGMSCKDGMTVNPNTCKCERKSSFGEDYELEEDPKGHWDRKKWWKKIFSGGKTAEDGGDEEGAEQEMDEVTGASSAGSYEGPLFGTMTESERILKSVIREEISKKISKTQLKESLKNRITRNLLNEKAFYNTGEFKYEKPTKLPGEIKSMPGMKQTDSTLKKSKSTNNEYLKHFDKKIKNYLDFEGNSHPEFPHQNNSKTDYKSPMYRNTGEDQEFIDDFRGMGLEDANGADMLDRMDDYLSGSQETGNAQTGKDGKALGNVVPSKTGDRIKKKVKRKKEKIAKQKSKMTNLRGMTPDVQTTSLKESTLLTEKVTRWTVFCCWLGSRKCCKKLMGSSARSGGTNPPTNPLSDAEVKQFQPYMNANSESGLPANLRKIYDRATATVDVPQDSGKVDGVVAEEVKRMKGLIKYSI